MRSPERSRPLLVRIAENSTGLAAVRELRRGYWRSIDLPGGFQDFGEELNGLPGVYGADGGALLLAWRQDTASWNHRAAALERPRGALLLPLSALARRVGGT